MASFLDLFGVVDSDGVNAARYRLNFLGSSLSKQDSWIFGMITELVYVFFQILVIPANAFLGRALDSGSWLGPLSDAYQRFTAPLYAVVPPWAIACLGLALVAVSALRAEPALKVGSATANRLGGALAMTATVLVLTSNPFALVSRVLELANGFSLGLAARVTGGDLSATIAPGQALVDTTVRIPTMVLNYGRELDPRIGAECPRLWSESMVTATPLSESSGCFSAGENVAGPTTVATAVLMLLLPALPMLVFAVVAAWKYVVHLTASVLALLATGWIAAASVHKRRGFENLTKAFAHSLAHLVIAVVTSMLAVALPATCAGIGEQLLGIVAGPSARAYVILVSLGIGFAVSTWVILKVTSNDGVLVRILDADANTTIVKLFGIDPKKMNPMEARTVARQKILDEEKANRKAAASSAAAAGGEKPSPLAKDPVAATQGARTAQKDPDDPSVSPDVVITAAAAISAADPSGPDPVVVLSATPDGGLRPADGPTAPAAYADLRTVDEYGFFFAEGDDEDDNVAGGRAVVFATVSRVPSPESGPGRGEAAESGTYASLSESMDKLSAQAAGYANDATAADDSVLSDLRGSSALGQEDTPPPVPGNAYADPALNAAATAAGVTVFTPGAAPEPSRRLPSWLRRFTNRRAASERGSVPDVEYGPPLSVPQSSPAGDANPKVNIEDGEQLTDQQRWNRLRRMKGLVQRTAGKMTPPSAASLKAGSNTHPGSYVAPMADFLSAEALQDEITTATEVFGAAGVKVNVAVAPSDRRIGIRLSSDPDERVLPRGSKGFGDPF